jgi:hypothetical protein
MPYANPEDRRAAVRRYHRDPVNRSIVGAAKRRWAERNREKRKAHVAVGNAIRDGKLVKGPCEVCGEQEVHGHHDDYGKPLEVRWLCLVHHGAAHGH